MGIAVLRHDKISALLTDRSLAQGSHLILPVQGVTEGPLVDWMGSIILTVEGADHARLRRLVVTAFTPGAVAALRPRMVQITHELVDRFTDDGLERIEAALEGLYTATDALIAARRADPQPDLLSALIEAEADGDRLSAQELRLMVTGLLFTGQDTTRHQLGHALALFLQHPAQWALLADRPELADRAVAEVVRLAPTTAATARVAAADIQVDGLTIPAGTMLTMLGANLARAELAEALPILARRLGPFEADGPAVWRPAMGITGPVTLPIRFAGGERYP